MLVLYSFISLCHSDMCKKPFAVPNNFILTVAIIAVSSMPLVAIEPVIACRWFTLASAALQN